MVAFKCLSTDLTSRKKCTPWFELNSETRACLAVRAGSYSDILTESHARTPLSQHYSALHQH